VISYNCNLLSYECVFLTNLNVSILKNIQANTPPLTTQIPSKESFQIKLIDYFTMVWWQYQQIQHSVTSQRPELITPNVVILSSIDSRIFRTILAEANTTMASKRQTLIGIMADLQFSYSISKWVAQRKRDNSTIVLAVYCTYFPYLEASWQEKVRLLRPIRHQDL